MTYRNPGPPPRLQTWYITFPFGTRHVIGLDLVDMSDRWAEVRAYTRQQALDRAFERFGDTGWRLYSDEAFTPKSRSWYPKGCCLVLTHLEK